MKPILLMQQDKKERKNFYASDADKLAIDIALELQGVPYTNPPEWTDTLKWGAGKGVELAMMKILKFNGIVAEDYDQETLPSTKIEREGVPISMRFDAQASKVISVKANSLSLPQQVEIEINEGEPIEIKSINNKNSFDIQKYITGNPRSNYVKQLAIYMDTLGKERGHLFASTIDGLNSFWFVCTKVGEGLYQAGNTIVNINDEYKRFAEIWANKDKEPNWFEETYKLPIEQVDWTKLSVSTVSEARNNRKVIGSENQWKLLYSPYLDLILEKQGVERGYSEEEITKIKEMTAGFTSKKKIETKVEATI